MKKPIVSSFILILFWAFFAVFFVIGNQTLRIFLFVAFTLIIIYETYNSYKKNILLAKSELLFDQIKFINNLTESLSGTVQLEEILALILKNLISGFNFDRAILFTVKTDMDERSNIEFMTGYAKSGKLPNYFYSCMMDKEKSILARSILENKIYIITDAPTNYFCEQALVDGFALKEFGLIPISIKSKNIGVILVDNNVSRNVIDDNTMKALKMYATHSGLAIEDSKAHDKIRNLAIKDGLTGIYNHRYFKDSLRKEFEKSQKDLSSLSLLFIDIDNFKKYNDTHGHGEGDKLLKDISRLIHNNLRETDIFSRYGGEEFVIILPGVNKHEAFDRAKQIRELVEKNIFTHLNGQPAEITTISIGVSTYPTDVTTIDNLTEFADKGLYMAKREGKNRVGVYSDKLKTEKHET